MTAMTDDRQAGRLQMIFEGDGHAPGRVFADYAREAETLVIRHVEAEPQLRNTGAAGRFMQALVDHARGEGLKLLPLCSYAALWLKRHPETQDLVASEPGV